MPVPERQCDSAEEVITRDGARLATDVYLPDVAQRNRSWRFGTVVIRLPYGRRGPVSFTKDPSTCVSWSSTRSRSRTSKDVCALWAALHGLASLSGSGKLSVVTRDDPRRLARLLIGGFLDGIELRRRQGSPRPDPD